VINQTRGYLAALVLVALAAAGCSPKPAARKKLETPTPTPTPAQKATATTPKASLIAKPTARPTAKPAVASKASTTKQLRIVAWNLAWFPGKTPEPTRAAEQAQMAAAKAALVELKPDVLLLEEIRDWESAAELCRAIPGLEVHVTSAFQSRPQNQVVASRFAADSAWSESWKPAAVYPPRGYSFAAVELPGPKFLLTYALHLKSNLGDLGENIAMRQVATRQLLLHVEEMLELYSQRGPTAVVIGGDMNTSLDDPRFAAEQTLPALIKAGCHWTHEGVPFANRTTIPGRDGFADNCFDHIFTVGLGTPTASVRAYPNISDHHPVVLEVDLANANFQPKFEAAAGTRLLDEAKAANMAPATVTPAAPGTLDAGNTEALTAAVGQPVVVRGRVSRVGNTSNNSIYFINFEGVPRGGFVAIVRRDHYHAVSTALGGDLRNTLRGKTVEIRGNISIFKDAPQVAITAPAQIRVVP